MELSKSSRFDPKKSLNTDILDMDVRNSLKNSPASFDARLSSLRVKFIWAVRGDILSMML
jgi:hypothetical protein